MGPWQGYSMWHDMITKTAWRSSARTGCLLVRIDQFPEGLAKFGCGGEVEFVTPITVRIYVARGYNVIKSHRYCRSWQVICFKFQHR